MKYSVIISGRAKTMLANHLRFLAQVNKASAIKLKDRIITEITSLDEMPNRYPFFNEKYIIPNKYHKMYIENRYLVIYQIKDDTVFVDYILDCRQDYTWLMK